MATSSPQGPAGALALIASRNVNMVSGQTLPNGDPYLQRQNEPSVAASTRNPLHLLAGANDYRTVDIPGNFDDGETGDAWLGVFKSFDGGERWQSTLLPGYPQDTSAEGMASPLKAYHAGADPVVRPGTNGLIYFAGLAFNRGEGAPSAIFVSRFVDNNNKENGDPIAYISTSIVAASGGASFLDKPWMVVDVPRKGAQVCRISTPKKAPVLLPGNNSNAAISGNAAPQAIGNITQQVLAGRMYVAYASITTTTSLTAPPVVESRIMLSRSDDCGASWTRPVQISRPEDRVNQGATMAIDPRTGTVHVAWRQFGLDVNAPDAIMTASSDASGKTFGKPRKVHAFPTGRKPDQLLTKLQRSHRMGDVHELVSIEPFDSNTAETRFRTNAYPTMAIDDESRVYLAWTERGYGEARPDPADGDARVVISTSRAGAAWTTPSPVDVGSAGADLPGHQMMPSMSYAAGRLMLVYYDLREDISGVFGPFVDDHPQKRGPKRHTIDVRAVQAPKGDAPAFGPSTKVSQYLMGNLRGVGGLQAQQLQFNVPNLPLFQLGSVPFMGDYIDVAPSPAFVQTSTGEWAYNTASTTAPVFHAVWTDNRDVHKPADGDWKNYTAPGSSVCQGGQTGMRNQNVYSARLTMGLVAGSPGNTKPLDPALPRAFVVFAQNTSYAVKSFRLTIPTQPAGGQAAFDQLGLAVATPLLTTVDVQIPARSMITRTVYATSTNPKAIIPVDVAEIAAPEASSLLSGGLASRVILNPDISNPDISNPDISNPDISNPDISNPDISNAEVYNPDISNPDISNPDISNPDISNPDISNPDISNVLIANPDISNPDISNPDISSPDISNPDISNPDISNPDISNGSLTDVTWTITNTGNTTASFNVNLFLAQRAGGVGGIKTQLVVHKSYKTPVSDGCTLKSQTQTVLVANVLNPTFRTAGDDTTFDPANPDISNTTLWLEPGGEGKITLRIVDPDPTDNITINPVTDVTPVVQADPVNTQDLGSPTPTPPATEPPPAAEAPVSLAFMTQPADTLVDTPIAPITVLATSNAAPKAGVQVTLAIAINPSAGHLTGAVTLLTDAAGQATFSGLSIEREGAGYALSASASAAGALPVLSAPFTIGVPLPPANPFVVTSTADTMTLGTLRYALTEANATPGPETITFSIDAGGEQVIALASPLPAIVAPVTIDGTTQLDVDGRPLVRVHGAATAGYGFEVQSPAAIRGLALTGFTGNPAVVVLAGGSGSVVERNYIGTDRLGTTGLGNNAGVILSGATGVIVRQNLLSGNAFSGVIVSGGSANEIRNNHIGTGPNGFGVLSNSDNGVTLFSGADGTIIDLNVISGNGLVGGGNGWGIDIQNSGGPDVTNTVITNNIIGLDAAGNLLERGGGDYVDPRPGLISMGKVNRGNSGGGVRVTRGPGTIIGTAAGGNTISGNTGSGIRVAGPAGTAPLIRGNRIGTDPTGTMGRGNRRGVEVFGGSTAVVGTPGAGNGNVISGNTGDGVVAGGDTVIENNLVGVDPTASFVIGNGNAQLLVDPDGLGPNPPVVQESGCCHTGITVTAPNNTVRGNVVGGSSANTQHPGIASRGAAGPPNVIEDNFVGVNAAGTIALPNGVGVATFGAVGTIVRRNLLAHNLLAGAFLVESSQGVILGGGNAADGNTIRNNPTGVIVGYNDADTGRATILSNRISGNTGTGIDLGWNGVTDNDGGDGDAGPNGQQNFPVLANASNGGPATTVDYTLDSLQINANHVIQVFASAACGPRSGERLVGSVTQQTNGSGDASGQITLNELVAAGQVLTATATDAAGNTSEFSACVTVPAAAPSVTITSVSPANGKPGEGFVVLRGTNLPAGIGDVVAEVVNGATTMNGFVHGGPTIPTAVYVRLPFGMPLGAGTIRLRNNAGTVVSNAFPIGITAVPGTPVINGILDGAFSPVAGPVAAGGSIGVQADGIDTTAAVVRFVQGASTWDVPAASVASGFTIGMAAQVTVPAAAAGGPISVSVRQGASAFSAPVAMTVEAPAPVLAGMVGGGGGTPFTIMCPAGTVATALHGRSGEEIDRTELMCSPVLAGPALGAAASAGAVGGFGGTDYLATLTCPAGSVMTGIHGRAGIVRWGGNVVDTLGVTCTNLISAAVFTSPTVGDSWGTALFAINCPAGQEVVGIAGGQGGLLDRIGIYCSNSAPPEPAPLVAQAMTPLSSMSQWGNEAMRQRRNWAVPE